MMIRGYLERSPPITVRTSAGKGGLEYLSRVTWPRINGREERGTVKFAGISEREGGREGGKQIGWKLTRGFPYGSLKISLLTYINQTYFYIYLLFFVSIKFLLFAHFNVR